MTFTVVPAMVIVPVRCVEPVLALTTKLTPELPVKLTGPPLPPKTSIQVTLLCAVHEQLLPVATLTPLVNVPPPWRALMVSGLVAGFVVTV